MDTSPLSSAARQLLADRLLLSPEQSDFVDELILLTCGSTLGSPTHEVRLTVTAPGLRELDGLRIQLCDWLKQSLPATGYNWVHDVIIEPHFDTNEPEIVVAIDDQGLLDVRSAGLVLEAARLFLEPFAAAYGRQVFTLLGNERLVPLHFEMPDLLSRWSWLNLPSSLELVQPRHYGLAAAVEGDDQQRARNFLTNALRTALDEFEQVSDVETHPVHAGTRISITYSERGPRPTASVLDAVEATVAQVLTRRLKLHQGFFTKLVFVPAYSHREEFDEANDVIYDV